MGSNIPMADLCMCPITEIISPVCSTFNSASDFQHTDKIFPYLPSGGGTHLLVSSDIGSSVNEMEEREHKLIGGNRCHPSHEEDHWCLLSVVLAIKCPELKYPLDDAIVLDHRQHQTSRGGRGRTCRGNKILPFSDIYKEERQRFGSGKYLLQKLYA